MNPITNLSLILNKTFKDDISVFIRDEMNYDSMHHITIKYYTNNSNNKDVVKEIFDLSIKNICNANPTYQLFSAYLIFNLSLEMQIENNIFKQAVDIILKAKNNMSIVPDYLKDEIIEILDVITADYNEQTNNAHVAEIQEENPNNYEPLEFDEKDMDKIFENKIDGEKERKLATNFINTLENYRNIDDKTIIFGLFYTETNKFNNLEMLFDIMENRKESYDIFFKFMLSFVMILDSNKIGNFRFLNIINSKLKKTTELYGFIFEQINKIINDFTNMDIPISELENLDKFELYFSRAIERVSNIEKNLIYHILAGLNSEGRNAIFHYVISLTYGTLKPNLDGIALYADLAELFFPKGDPLYYVFFQYKINRSYLDLTNLPSSESFLSVSHLFWDSTYFHYLIEKLPDQKNNLNLLNAYYSNKYSLQKKSQINGLNEVKRIFFSKLVDYLNNLYVCPGSKIYHN